MTFPTLSQHPVTRTAQGAAPAGWAMVGAGLAAALAATALAHATLTPVLLSAGATLVALAALLWLLNRRSARTERAVRARIAELVGQDAAPCFTTDADGEVGYQNRAAHTRFGGQDGRPLARALRDLFASPSAVLFRLQNRAEAAGAAREDVVTRRGHVRISVHRLDSTGFLWRLEEIAERNAPGRGADALSLPMLTASKNGTVLFMNEALRRLVGGRVKSLDRLFTAPPQAGAEVALSTSDGPVRARLAEVEGPGGRREMYLLPADGDAAPADTAPAADARPPAPHAASEMTEFETLPVALIRLSDDGTVRRANHEARRLLAAPDHGPLRLQDLLDDPGRPMTEWLSDALAGRALERPEVVCARRAEQERFVQVTLRRMGTGDDTELLAVLNDATELKSLEEKFVQSQKMQAIGHLAGGVAHDFNNLLTAIAGHCDLLLLRHGEGDPDFSDLAQIHHNTNRAGSLVAQLLAFSRKQTLKPEILDLRDTLSDLTHLLNRLVGEKVRLTLDHDEALAPVRVDKRQLEQVMMNLVVNARDAMPDGGEIRIETEAQTLENELRRDRAVVPPGDYVLIRVRDEGAGIAPDKLGRVFEPFYTTKRTGEGTGLGLSTVYGIIKQTGGFVFGDSAPGAGTTFTIYLPAHEAPAPGERPGDARRTLAGRAGDGVVLLVEDEAPVRAFAARALRMRGFTVLEAENAEAALESLKDTNLHIDLFVTDVIMPGKDGPSWVLEALQHRPDVKVVFVSGYAEGALEDARSAVPNSVFLPKPFSLEDLTATVHEQIGAA